MFLPANGNTAISAPYAFLYYWPEKFFRTLAQLKKLVLNSGFSLGIPDRPLLDRGRPL